MPRYDPFEYIRNTYVVPAKKGQRVKYRERTGTIAKAEGAYIYILLDGDLKLTGPYHPTSEMEYLREENTIWKCKEKKQTTEDENIVINRLEDHIKWWRLVTCQCDLSVGFICDRCAHIEFDTKALLAMDRIIKRGIK